LLKNSFSVIPEVFIGNPVFVKSTAYGFPLSREWHYRGLFQHPVKSATRILPR